MGNPKNIPPEMDNDFHQRLSKLIKTSNHFCEILGQIERKEKHYLNPKTRINPFLENPDVDIDNLIDDNKKMNRAIMKLQQNFIDYSSVMEQIEGDILSSYITKLNLSDTFLKDHIKKIEDVNLRKALNKHYIRYKRDAIISTIKNKTVSWNKELTRENAIGHNLDERIIEFPLAFEIGNLYSSGKILDAGGALNIDYLWKNFDPPVSKITHFTQSSDKQTPFFLKDFFSYVFGDLRKTDFQDETFDRILCISTLEHIGMDNSRYGGATEQDSEAYKPVIIELLRILKKGGSMLLTFPYGKPENRGWFRIFSLTEVQTIIDLVKRCSHEERYYYYDDCWTSGPIDGYLRNVSEKSSINGIAAVVIRK
jgi:hypothetical protein